MAVVAYYRWDRLGRPLEPARPIRELVEGLRVAFPLAAKANLFSWYANEAHYTAVPAQDHTPFSQTGWPEESAEWVVHATDIMHRPDLGVDCFKLAAYYLAEAKAGRMPWLKYMIWRGQIFDVRNGWRPQPASGHYDHIHLSSRTDHDDTSLGDWSVNGDDMAISERDFDILIWRVEALIKDRPLVAGGPTKGEVNQQHIANEAAKAALTPEQLAAIEAAAREGAEAGAEDALDGATVTATIDTKADA